MRNFSTPFFKFVGVALLLSACASTRPLSTRGLSPDERKWWVVQNGYGLSESVKKAFLDGYLEIGMKKDMIYQLYGPPDRTERADSTWEYIGRSALLITGLKFSGDKLAEIYGDRTGGLQSATP